MSWTGHKATFWCDDHPKLTVRARTWRLFDADKAPRCRTCGKPMTTIVNLAKVWNFGRIRRLPRYLRREAPHP